MMTWFTVIGAGVAQRRIHTASNCLQGVRQGRGRGIPWCFGDKGMRGKGRGLEVHTLAYPCTLSKGTGVCLCKNII